MNFQLVFFLTVFLINNSSVESKEKEEIVEKWASRIGNELWELGKSVTRVYDIRQSYKNLNARVLPTDGEGILQSIVSNVNRLLKQKMDSVMCLIENAERLSENFNEHNRSGIVYFSSKYSQKPGVKIYKSVDEDDDWPGVNFTHYKDIDLEADEHFYNINVNTSYSAVHVPTDVYDQGVEVSQALRWSEDLDETFIRNYQADPTMSWQYFGSATGFLRHYPALQWSITKGRADEFDCRTRFWYIEAATCTKDAIILMDNSGSMDGVKNTIAKLTVRTLLDTFSNNDFINLFRFNDTIDVFEPCFPADMLVQATPENIHMFKRTLQNLTADHKPYEKALYLTVLSQAFELLSTYRKQKDCPDDICNQAIILITDNYPGNLTHVFQKYNWFNNRTKIPVRVFLYYIGKEVVNLPEVKKIACLNRGYFGHIKSLEEVRSEVLKYLNVIARPMVLQAVEHPLSWTHSFVDATGQVKPDGAETGGYRFMTSVSGPAFDKRPHGKGNETRLPELLGVAGTDVLVSDIKSLTLPYKIGANGYAFVITNNGYLLFHPDLRPTYDCEGKICVKDNYNSVDLTEIELLDDNETEPRKPSEEILELRAVMVNGTEGSIPGLKIKFHYDNMKRVGVETRNYFFAPLENTPFTMGLVLPHSYGNFWIKAGDEIMKSKQMGIPITSYFKGNWKIHPDWVYCDYHRTSVRHFDSPEHKLMHFLEKISSPDWKWKERFPDELFKDINTHNCYRPSINESAYFCDKELMQLLVFDAKITEVSYKTSKWAAKDRRETELVKRYGASLRFLATQSGLTRWQVITPDDSDEKPTENEQSFGDKNNKALEEVWYRSAVLHHQLDSDAFVFTVPFDSGGNKNLKVTATHAIFPKDGGHEAPGSVVGFQIDYEKLLCRFREFTSKRKCTEKGQSTEFDSWNDFLDCYLIDVNGYIVLSKNKNDTGRFFGDVAGAVFNAMIAKNIFRKVVMFDYQAVCQRSIEKNFASRLLSPFKAIFYFIEWIIGKTLWLIFESEFYKLVYASEDYDYEIKKEHLPITTTKKPVVIPEKKKERIVWYDPCDKNGTLYLLQQENLKPKEGYHSDSINCSKPFHVKRVPHTNLLLIVVDSSKSGCFGAPKATMEEIEYNKPSSCMKLNLNSLPRRKLTGCFNTHPSEDLFYVIESGASSIHPTWMWLLIFKAIIVLL